MKIKAFGVLILQFWLSVVDASDGREFAVKAVEFRIKWGQFLQLGDCVDVYAKRPNQAPINEGLKFTGDTKYVDDKRTDLSFNRLNTALDSTTRTMGGITVGVDLLGLVSADVEGKVTVTIKTKKNTLQMEAVLDVGRGMDQITFAQPNQQVLRQANQCPFYLSEIVYGGTEKLVVQFEFTTRSKTVEVEVTITVKILFIKISVKMHYMHTTNSGGGRCSIVRISTYADQTNQVVQAQTFTRDQFQQAILAVEAAENHMNGLPDTLNGMSLTEVRQRLPLMYYFSKAIINNVYQPSIAANQWAYQQARMQYLELDNTLNVITEELGGRGLSLSSTDLTQLQNLKQTITSLRTDLGGKLERFYDLALAELRSLHTIYGDDKASGYYWRQMRKILPEETFKVCTGRTISTSGRTAVDNGITLAQCGEACKLFNFKRGCTMYTFKLTATETGVCTVFDGSTCSASQINSATTLVLTDRAACSTDQIGASGCAVQGFVD